MKHTKWFAFPSATAVVIAFFLPWFSISCKSPTTTPGAKVQTQRMVAFTGYNFASGKMPPIVESMFALRKQLAGLGNMMRAFFKKKKKAIPVVKKPSPIDRLRKGFPTFWGAMASFGIAALLGLWFAIRGPTTALRIAGTVAIFVGIGCLLYPAFVDLPNFKRTPRMNIKMISVQLEIGGYLLLSGIISSLVSFWASPNEHQNDEPQSPK